jgi:glycosyltransferase involved in cell wall biosynthesis
MDYCFHAIAALGSPFGSTPWCGITMRTEFAEHGDGENMRLAMRHVLLRRMLSEHTTRAVFSIDPRSQLELKRRASDRRYAKLRYLADPAELDPLPDRDTARSEFSIGRSQKALLLFGSSDLRKGLEEMLRGVAATKDPSEWTILIAGKQTDAAAETIAQWRSATDREPLSLRIVDGVVASSDVPRLFAAADAVWIGYPNHAAMSGVLVQAAMAGKPLIAQAGSLLGEIVTRTQMGVACDVTRANSVATALGKVSTEQVAAAARLGPEKFSAHTTQAFGQCIVQAIGSLPCRAAA